MNQLPKTTQPHPGMRLNIELGNPLLIKSEGLEAPVKSALIGLESHKYLIIQIPSVSEFRDRLGENQKLKISYVTLGMTYEFDATVLGYTLKPFKLLFLSYPESVQEADKRRESRVNCHIPATANINQTPLNGVITDINNHGCRFIVRIPTKIQPYQVRILTDVNLSFALHGIEGSEQLQGVVRNTTIDRFRIALGIEFEKIGVEVSDKLRDYLENLGDVQTP
jgi:hypothetical protein